MDPLARHAYTAIGWLDSKYLTGVRQNPGLVSVRPPSPCPLVPALYKMLGICCSAAAIPVRRVLIAGFLTVGTNF